MATGKSRQDWLALFEAAAGKPSDDTNEYWRLLLQKLRLRPSHYLALVETLRQGRWRTADNPKAYVKRVTRIEASKMEAAERDLSLHFVPDDPEGEDGGGISALLDRNALADTYSEPMRSSDGIWRPIDQYRWYGDADYEEDDDGNRVETYRDHLLAKIPGALKETKAPTQELIRLFAFLNESHTDHHYHAKPNVQVDWKEWGKQAGLDTWELRVLKYRAAGVSREVALAKQPNETSTKALQAAWRKFDRTGKDRLKASAEKVREQMSRNGRNRTLDK
jgi:hypothetical protein